MAVTFATTINRLGIGGDTRINTGTITATGTTTDNGDALTAAQLGLHTIRTVIFTPFVDSTSNPENAMPASYIATSPGAGGSLAGVVVFFGGATAAEPLDAVADATTVTGFAAQYIAFGT